MSKATHYLWLDLETTGLENADQIMEIAMILTDTKLVEMGTLHEVLPIDDRRWERLRRNPFVLNMHGKTGLLGECAALTDDDGWQGRFETDITCWLGELTSGVPDRNIRMAGSGVSHFDLHVVKRWLPKFSALLDWRPFDVGQMEEWFIHCGLPTYDDTHPGEKDRKTHRAMDDIAYHLDEARWYCHCLITLAPKEAA